VFICVSLAASVRVLTALDRYMLVQHQFVPCAWCDHTDCIRATVRPVSARETGH